MQLRLSCGLFSFAVSSLKISISIGVLIIIRISSCLSSNGVAWSEVMCWIICSNLQGISHASVRFGVSFPLMVSFITVHFASYLILELFCCSFTAATYLFYLSVLLHFA